jgi:hypothetical protein
MTQQPHPFDIIYHSRGDHIEDELSIAGFHAPHCEVETDATKAIQKQLRHNLLVERIYLLLRCNTAFNEEWLHQFKCNHTVLIAISLHPGPGRKVNDMGLFPYILPASGAQQAQQHGYVSKIAPVR